MRQLHHPAIKDVTVEGILYAFSDPVRVRIFMELAGAECTKNCTNFVNIDKTPMAKSTLSQHFRILREAGLIYSERKGVELHNRTRCAELKDRFGEMVGAIIAAYAKQQQKQKKPLRKNAAKPK
ncbi:MAG: transcriptional regulator [Alphaproteobacteria bacterium]|nr:transcriptional regulator [Alphaproteobacteria bacterium]